MSFIHGKQLRTGSIELGRLDGTGIVSFTTATMSFEAGSILTTNDANITSGESVVNKNYVDSIASGLDIKESVRLKIDTNITLSGTQSIQGYDLEVGDRVLVNGQNGTDPSADNGIYEVQETSWIRASDSDGSPSNEVSLGNFTFVEFGNFNSSGWVLSQSDATNPDEIDVGVDTQYWTKFSSQGEIIAGDGLTKTGTTIDVGAGTGLEVDTTSISLSDTGVLSGAYGNSYSVSTFTVNAQGQLTIVGEEIISITASQISDFDTASKTSIFSTNNFIDSDSIEFTINTGNSVESNIIAGTGIGIDNSGVFVKIDNNTIVFDNNQLKVDLSNIGAINEVIAGLGLTGGGTSSTITIDAQVNNGLEIIDDNIGIGGTLSRTTLIDGNSNDFIINNLTNYIITATSSFDINVDNGVILLDSGETGSIDMYGGDITLFATGSNDIISTEKLNLQTHDFDLDFSGSGTVSVGSATQGLIYSATPSNSSPLTLIHKQYIDNIINILPGAGLVDNSGALDVNTGLGLEITNDEVAVEWGGTASGLTFSTNSIGVNVDNDTIVINSIGELEVVDITGLKSEPIYQDSTSLNQTSLTNEFQTGITLGATPSTHSRINVFVNGQQQQISFGDKTGDCYFSTDGGTTAKTTANIIAGDELIWNGINAEFTISNDDDIEIIYEG